MKATSRIQEMRGAKAFFQARKSCFLKYLAEVEGTHALSVSAGEGYWDLVTLQESKSIKEITATDIIDCALEESDIKELKSIGKWNFQKVKAEDKLPFSDNQYDLVYHMDVLEHVEKPYLFLSEQLRVLKKGGKLILGVPHLFRPTNAIKLLLGKLNFPMDLGSNDEIGDYIHIQEFTTWHLENLLSEIGFKDIKYLHCYWGIRALGIMFKEIPRSKIGKQFCQYLFITGIK